MMDVLSGCDLWWYCWHRAHIFPLCGPCSNICSRAWTLLKSCQSLLWPSEDLL